MIVGVGRMRASARWRRLEMLDRRERREVLLLLMSSVLI